MLLPTVRVRAFGGSDYPVGSAAKLFGFDGPFDYETLTTLPPAERYPLAVAIPKSLVVLALRIPLRSDARWPDLATLDRLYARLGRPAITARCAAPGVRPGSPAPGVPPPSAGSADLSDEAFLRLRRDGPHAHWVRRADDGWIVDYREILAGIPVRPGQRLEPCALRWGPGGPAIWIAGVWIAPADPVWREARRLFHLAELHVHEVVSHLSWTHLHAETVALTTVEHLPPGHPIRELLAPFFACTLQANRNSGGVLLGRGGVFDRVFSCGWLGAAELLRRAEQSWTYARMVPWRDAAQRQIATLQDYPWFEDSCLLWDAVEAHVRRRIPEADDAARAWAAALFARYGDRGWPAVADHATLVEIVTACAFLTVRHTLVNAQQYSMFGYPPLWQATMPAAAETPVLPFSLREKVAPYSASDEGSPGVSDDLPPLAPASALAQLPTIGETLDTLRATFAFSIQFNSLQATDDAAFAADLEAIAAVIALRDQGREHPYGVGHPGKVSGSICA